MSVDDEDPRQVEDIECEECGQMMETRFEDGSYEIEGYTKREAWPDETVCPFCKGEEGCSEDNCTREAMVYATEEGVNYCSQCWAKQCDGNVAEFEELIFRRPEEKEEADENNRNHTRGKS